MRELQRLENWVGGREKDTVRERSWASMRAMRRLEVTGFAPADRYILRSKIEDNELT